MPLDLDYKHGDDLIVDVIDDTVMGRNMSRPLSASVDTLTSYMLVAGVALPVAGFAVAPVGEIHDSVLWYFAQCLIYAGSAVGIDVIIDKRVRDHQNP